METKPAPEPESQPELQLDIQQEVRFAVVMYGGVSLAIYINGVAQELLRLVRATAPDPNNSLAPLRHVVTGSEAVYRRIGQLLRPDPSESVHQPAADAPIRTRFVVDILSGTSAGGINAIFLAKALANDQDMDALKDLWVDEGDIEKLVNDRESVRGIPDIQVQSPPKSLLNSQRMYRKLLNAFDGMDQRKPSNAKSKSPHVEELDLFVTTTDIAGLPIQLRLADAIVEERRHRNVFRFRYQSTSRGVSRNDFQAGNNKFLAFAARCTSSFPFAFEPMRLRDIDAETDGDEGAPWQDFFPDYRTPDTRPTAARGAYNHTTRPFADGGYLDNKPFSYATAALASRRASVPVDRKLLYIEPSPDIVSHQKPGEGPNAVENVVAALSLARYETIREDLERILERNRLIERVERIISGMEDDVRKSGRVEPPTREGFADADLGKMIETHGIAYGGYHRLKVAALTDAITGIIARAAGFDPDSDHFLAIRYFVRVWRDREYVAYREEDTSRGKPTQNRFVVDYDLPFRLRRLSFVLAKIDQLGARDPRTKTVFAQVGAAKRPQTDPERAEFRRALAEIRTGLGEVQANLQQAQAKLLGVGEANPLHVNLGATHIGPDLLKTVLELPNDGERLKRAEDLIVAGGWEPVFSGVAAALSDYIRTASEPASKTCENILGGSGPHPEPSTPTALAVALVRHYYYWFDQYDMISYPILYSTEVGEETDPVEILRVSPRDAPTLIDEVKTHRRKLAGTTLMNFGAFLDRGWRRNDMLWGRLDGAERLITALMPAKSQAETRQALVRDAQIAILAEEYVPDDADTLCQLLADAVGKTESTDRNEATLRELVTPATGSPLNPHLQSALRANLTPDRLWEFFRTRYEVNREINPKTAVRTIARATQVVGRVLEQIAVEYRVNGRPAAWIARLGRTFWGLIEVAVPRSLSSVIFRYWLQLLYFFEAFLVVGGLLLGKADIQQFGVSTLVITALIHLTTAVLAEYMQRGKKLRRATGVIVALVILGFAGVGAYASWRAYTACEWLKPVALGRGDVEAPACSIVLRNPSTKR